MRDTVFLCLLVCLLLLLACYLLVMASGPFTQDFRAFYAAGQMLLHCRTQLYSLPAQQQWQDAAAGGNFGLPFYHPAYEALLYAPLTVFHFKTAYLIYAVWNMLLLWVCSLVLPGGDSPLARMRRPALFLSFPVLLAIFVGQNSVLMLLAFSVAYTALSRGQDRVAGIILGLTTFKLATIFPLALLLSVRRGRRFAVPFLISSAACIAFSIVLTGLRGTADFLHLLSGAALALHNGIAAQQATAVSPATMPNLVGLLYLLGSRYLPSHLASALNLSLALVLLAGCAWIQRHSSRESVAFSAALLCAVLVSPHLYIYDYSVLLLPLLLLSHPAMKYIAILWFLVPPALFVYGHFTWFAPAVLLPIALIAVCIVEFRSESSPALLTRETAAAP